MLEKEATTTPYVLFSLPPHSTVNIVQIFANRRTCGLVLSDGKVLTWGCTFWGSGHESEVSKPTCPPGAENFNVVFGSFLGNYGDCHLFVVEKNGLCWEKEETEWKMVSLDAFFPRLMYVNSE